MFDFEDFFGDEAVMLMSHTQIGIYLRLLSHDWHNGSIPSDWALVERLVKLPSTEADDFAAMVDLIKGKYIAVEGAEGRITNRRLQTQREEQREAYQKAVDRGQKGGRAAAERRRQREAKAGPGTERQKTKAEKAAELLAIAKPAPCRFDDEGFLHVTPEEVLRLQNDYPNVDVAGEIRKASNWNHVQSPSNRKKKASTFLINWLNRERSKGIAKPKGRADANLRNVQARQARLEAGDDVGYEADAAAHDEAKRRGL
jgi:uncharacterized protein YdaU (DUF1376 family)